MSTGLDDAISKFYITSLIRDGGALEQLVCRERYDDMVLFRHEKCRNDRTFKKIVQMDYDPVVGTVR